MKKYLSLTILAALISGCASYKAMPLNTITSDTICFQSTRNAEVTIVAKEFNQRDCKKYLDRDVIKKGYQPVQVSIENQSDKNYVFSLNRVSLPCAAPEEVAAKVHTSTIARAAGYGAAALIFWPFAVPAVIDGVRSMQANTSLDNDFSAKTARDQVIAAYSHVHMLLFIPKESYRAPFNITLFDLTSNKPCDFIVDPI